MKIEFTENKTDGKTIQLVAGITFGLDEFEKAGSSDYDRRKLFRRIEEKITEKVAAEYLTAKRDEILAAIDIEQIIKGVQFKTINEFGKQGNVGG